MKHKKLSAKQIVELLGGIRPTARKLECGPTTVANWKATGKIPHWWRPHIVEVSRELSVSLVLLRGEIVQKLESEEAENSVA